MEEDIPPPIPLSPRFTDAALTSDGGNVDSVRDPFG